jgi:periplasmic divalent cation tolerance protein
MVNNDNLIGWNDEIDHRLSRGAVMAKKRNQGEYAVILVTVNSQEEALRIARALVDSRLAACVNIISGLRSIYRWKGKSCDEGELLLLIKTRIALFEQVEGKIKEIHSYEVPEIVAIPITRGSETYLNWLNESTLS